VLYKARHGFVKHRKEQNRYIGKLVTDLFNTVIDIIEQIVEWVTTVKRSPTRVISSAQATVCQLSSRAWQSRKGFGTMPYLVCHWKYKQLSLTTYTSRHKMQRETASDASMN